MNGVKKLHDIHHQNHLNLHLGDKIRRTRIVQVVSKVRSLSKDHPPEMEL